MNHEKRNMMKKYFISALLLCVSLSLISCDGNGNKNKDVSSVEQTTSHSEEKESSTETDNLQETTSKKSEAEQNNENAENTDSSDKKSEILENENQSEENQLLILDESKYTVTTVTTKGVEKTIAETSETITKPMDSTAETTTPNAGEINVAAATDEKSSDVIELPFIPIEDIK